MTKKYQDTTNSYAYTLITITEISTYIRLPVIYTGGNKVDLKLL